MANPYFTIGHSVRPLDVFVGLLKNVDVRLVVDVRAIPRSRTNPQYNVDTLPSSLLGFQIGYERIAELGGRRGRQRNVPSATNAFWQNESFHNYADYAMARTFTSRWRGCENSVIPSGAPSCARRCYGGDVTGGSFRII